LSCGTGETENEQGRAVVHAFELEPATGAYAGVGIFRERMKVSAPFDMELDPTRSCPAVTDPRLPW
jgi:hypothetical protein